MSISAFWKKLFGATPVPKPDDLIQFELAKKELHRSSRALSRKADEFGDLVRGMQGTSRKTTKKRPRKK